MASPGTGEVDPRLARLARNLREARKNAGLSQRDVAELAGLSQSAISALEQAKRDPGVLTLLAIARALHLKPTDLLGDIR